MADFNQAFALTSKWEGGYSNRKNDRGKETYWGISRKNWPKWEGWVIVDQFSPLLKNGQLIKSAQLDNLVEVFYFQNFWNKVKGVFIINQPIANVLFDWSVTSGIHAAKAMQKLVGVAVDGKIGPKTLTAINNCEPRSLFESLNDKRRAFYNRIADNDPTQQENSAGWLNRTNSFIFY